MKIRFILYPVFVFFFLESTLVAYPSFINFGHTSCISCHFNPQGNGPLTDYGRAISASAISNRLFWSKDTAEEEIAERSGFFFGPSPVKSLHPSLNFRRMGFRDDLGTNRVPPRYITMDLSASLVATLLDKERLILAGQIAYVPPPLLKAEKERNYRSREHYIGYRISKELGFYAGLMDKPFGIRIPEHTAYSRMVTNNTMNDQTHGFMVHVMEKWGELGVQAFLGNLSQDEDLRQKGITAMGEWEAGKMLRIGASALTSLSNFRRYNMYAVHTRVGFNQRASGLFETGIVKNTLLNTHSTKDSFYMFSQASYNLVRGLFTYGSVEYLQADTKVNSRTWRLGPGLQFFPMQRIELRWDLYNTRIYSANTSSNNWQLLAQLHLWF